MGVLRPLDSRIRAWILTSRYYDSAVTSAITLAVVWRGRLCAKIPASFLCSPGNNLNHCSEAFLKSNLFRSFALSLLGLFCLASLSASAQSGLVISQVYGGGGNSGATYKNDFVELYNPTSSAISVGGYSVQYAGATGTAWQVTTLTAATIQPGHHYLVQEAAGANLLATALPTPDATGTIP